MPLPPEIELLLRRITSDPTAAAQMAATKGKIYELWLVANIANALRLKKWLVEMRASDETLTSQFIQRGAPGLMQPRSAGASNPGFFHLRRPDGLEFELHNSLVFKGRSRASHEFDICIFGRPVGRSLRRRASAQRAVGHPMFSIECKQYTTAIGIDVPRAVIASTFDATRWTLPALQHRTRVEGHAVANYKSFAGRMSKTFTAIATPNGVTIGAKRLANRYNIRLFDNVEVGKSGLNKLLGATVSWLNRYAG